MTTDILDGLRINFRIRPNDDINHELDRLAAVMSKKYKRDLDIVIKERHRR